MRSALVAFVCRLSLCLFRSSASSRPDLQLPVQVPWLRKTVQGTGFHILRTFANRGEAKAALAVRSWHNWKERWLPRTQIFRAKELSNTGEARRGRWHVRLWPWRTPHYCRVAQMQPWNELLGRLRDGQGCKLCKSCVRQQSALKRIPVACPSCGSLNEGPLVDEAAPPMPTSLGHFSGPSGLCLAYG